MLVGPFLAAGCSAPLTDADLYGTWSRVEEEPDEPPLRPVPRTIWRFGPPADGGERATAELWWVEDPNVIVDEWRGEYWMEANIIHTELDGWPEQAWGPVRIGVSVYHPNYFVSTGSNVYLRGDGREADTGQGWDLR